MAQTWSDYYLEGKTIAGPADAGAKKDSGKKAKEKTKAESKEVIKDEQV
jgi:hypothetical protein